MFSFGKSYRFEVIHSDNIKVVEITSPGSLINFTIGANNELIKNNQEGWVYFEKFECSKKGEKRLFAQKVDLPILEDNPYFDQLLEGFYTKKVLPYEEVVLVKPEPEENEESQELPKELQALAEAGSIMLKKEEQHESEVSNKEKDRETEELREQLARQQQRIDELVYLQEQQMNRNLESKEEKALLVEQKELYSDVKTPVSIEKDYEEVGLSLDTNPNDITSDDSILYAQPSTTDAVSEVLEKVKMSFSDRLSTFVSEETKKIKQELSELDTRHSITEEVSKRIESEKKRTLEAEEHMLKKEHDETLHEEQLRHNEAIATIEKSFNTKKIEKQVELEQHFKKKQQADIHAEYERQTKQLNRILQGKMDELALKQREMNDGLKANFTQVLDTFNESHENVIKDVEKIKETNQIIDFSAHKQAVSE